MADRDFTAIQPDRIGAYVEERNIVFPIIAGIIAIVLAVGFAGYYFYITSEMFNPYRKTYEKLGIDLPRSFERFELASRHWPAWPVADRARDAQCLMDAAEACPHTAGDSVAAEGWHPL
jgi:hypothetical protein